MCGNELLVQSNHFQANLKCYSLCTHSCILLTGYTRQTKFFKTFNLILIIRHMKTIFAGCVDLEC